MSIITNYIFRKQQTDIIDYDFIRSLRASQEGLMPESWGLGFHAAGLVGLFPSLSGNPSTTQVNWFDASSLHHFRLALKTSLKAIAIGLMTVVLSQKVRIRWL